MSVVEFLRNTPKGKLTYSKDSVISKLQDEIDHYSPPPLSRSHQEKESSLLNLSFGLDSSGFDSDTKLNYNDNANQTQREKLVTPKGCALYKAQQDLEDEIEKLDRSKDEDPNETSLVASPPRDSSTYRSIRKAEHSFGTLPCAIFDEEQLWESVAQLSVYGHTSKFDDHARALEFLMKQKEGEIDKKLDQMSHSRQNIMEQHQQESRMELQKRMQRLKEDHEQHQKKIVNKHQEMERQREKLEEEKQQRIEEERQKRNTLQSLMQEIEANKQTFIELQDVSSLDGSSQELVAKFRSILENVCSNLNAQLDAAQNLSFIPEELITKFEGDKNKSSYTVELLKKQIEIAREKAKEEKIKQKELEKAKNEELKKKEKSDKLAQEASQDFGVQSLAYVLKEAESKRRLLVEVEKEISGFMGNSEMKKHRFDLQRSINTPINAISPVSGSHLRDKLQSLLALLGGQTVPVSSRQVSTRISPDAPLFCQNLMAKMFVKKGEEQVTSNHESAFAIGAVIVGIWIDFPKVGELFLAHLQALCPFVLPYYSPSVEGQSTQDYLKARGYKIDEDGAVEEQDKYLHRMSGLMRLYCACMVATPPKGAGSSHPCSVQHAWMWLARTLNMEPQADVTAAMIFDVLSVTGHFLFQEYKVQFVKLLYILYKHYLPKLKAVSVTNSIVGRLEIFLETALKNNARISPPKGLLPPNFWHS